MYADNVDGLAENVEGREARADVFPTQPDYAALWEFLFWLLTLFNITFCIFLMTAYVGISLIYLFQDLSQKCN